MNCDKEVWIIRHKETKKLFRSANRNSWHSSRIAKQRFSVRQTVRFDDKNEWELINLTEILWRYEDLQK